MGNVEQAATLERSHAPRKQPPRWIGWWCIVVWILVGADFVWAGFPERPEGVGFLEDRGPLIFVGAGVAALLVLAGVQSRWGKGRGHESADAGWLGIRGCPAWCGYAAVGTGLVGAVVYAYAAFRSLGGDAAVHVLPRRAAIVLMLGSYGFFELISSLSNRGREDSEAGKEPEYAVPSESRSELQPFRRWLLIVLMILPMGAFVAVALAAGRGGSLAVALAALAGLFVTAQLLARWNRGVGEARSSAALPSLHSCPPLFGYLVLGLTIVLFGYFVYVAFWAPNDHVGDSSHVVVRLAPLAVFLFGALGLLQLLPKLAFGRGAGD